MKDHLNWSPLFSLIEHWEDISALGSLLAKSTKGRFRSFTNLQVPFMKVPLLHSTLSSSWPSTRTRHSSGITYASSEGDKRMLEARIFYAQQIYAFFLINSLVSIKELKQMMGGSHIWKTTGAFFFLEPYWPQSTDCKEHTTLLSSEIITLIFKTVEHLCKTQQLILLFSRSAQESALTSTCESWASDSLEYVARI